MTHNDIYTKFMIEYDKDSVTSSYPSLTKYELATILDKAYLALIARKLTGNNPRKSSFEYDIKAVEDLRPLVKNTKLNASVVVPTCENELVFDLAPDNMYYISGMVTYGRNKTNVAAGLALKQYNTILVPRSIADKFKVTGTNLPWIKTPVVTIDGNVVRVLIDPLIRVNNVQQEFIATYIKKPAMFTSGEDVSGDSTVFELSDTMAEELISLAILFAVETVQSTRINTKSQLIGLES